MVTPYPGLTVLVSAPLQLPEVLVLRDEGDVPVCSGGGHEGVGEFHLVAGSQVDRDRLDTLVDSGDDQLLQQATTL
jgi:hypothetical protein